MYAAGEITGVAGAPAAEAEGALAGWIAAGGDPGAPPCAGCGAPGTGAGPSPRGWPVRTPSARPGPAWLRPETVVCRCEETDYAALCRAATDPASAAPRVAKLGTRAGLGPCQARICGPTVAELGARLRGEPLDRPVEGLPAASAHRRPIAQPIRLGELAAPPDRPPSGPPGTTATGPTHTKESSS